MNVAACAIDTDIRSVIAAALEEHQSTEPVITMILRDAELTEQAIRYVVDGIRAQIADQPPAPRSMVARERKPSGPRPKPTPVPAVLVSNRLVADLVDYGLSVLDVQFGEKRLGDYLPDEALCYASQQHEAARCVAVRARFVASVAKACPDAERPIREQIEHGRVEMIRQIVVEGSPNPEMAKIALAFV